MDDKPIYQLDHDGRRIRIYEKEWHNGYRQVRVEYSRPDRCPCTRDLSLAQAVSLMLNITDDEFWQVQPRCMDANNHPTEIPPGVSPDEYRAIVENAVARSSAA